ADADGDGVADSSVEPDADADGDGVADSSVEPDTVQDTEDTFIEPDTVADADGDGVADSSVEPDTVQDTEDTFIEPDTVADADGDGVADSSVEPDVVNDAGDTLAASDGDVGEDADAPIKPDTMTAPVLGEPLVDSALPSGNGCFNANNDVTVNWYGSDQENQPLSCEVSVVNVGNKVEVAKVAVPAQNPSPKMKAKIPASLIEPFIDYDITVKCTDTDGLSASETTNQPVNFFHKNTIMWVRFKDGVGNVVTDSGPSKLHGTVVGKADWVVKSGLILDGNTRVEFPKSSLFNSANELSVFLVFEPKTLDQSPFATVLEVMNQLQGQRLAVDVPEKGKVRFSQSYVGAAQSIQDVMAAGINELLFIQDGSGAQIVKWVGGWKAVAQSNTYTGPVKIDDGGSMTLGCWADGTHCFVGTLYEVQIVAKNTIATCQ
ncbi:MAG: hypothetical protein COV45_03825, partial [Deltaproteobacteria bacterium CG11_big_fil_rev_8_21_14_0_20_47_16]